MEDDIASLADSGNVTIHRGFPNPSEGRVAQGGGLALDLNKLCIRQPSSTYLFRINGHSNEADGLHDGDIAVVDRALGARPSDLVLAWQAGGFVLCRYSRLRQRGALWGVVSSTIHHWRKP